MAAAALRPAAVLSALRRTAPGPRVLHVLLFVGGLLALGLLLGAPAHAAESPADATTNVRAAVPSQSVAHASPTTGRSTVAAGAKAGATGTTGATDTTGTAAGSSADPASPTAPASPADRWDAAAKEFAEQPVVREVRRAAAGSVRLVEATGAARAVPAGDSLREMSLPVTDSAMRLVGSLLGVLTGPLPQGDLPGTGGIGAVPDGLTVTQPASQDAVYGAVPAGPGSVVGGTGRAAPDQSGAVAGRPGAHPDGEQDARVGGSRLESVQAPARAPAPGPFDPCRSLHGVVPHSGETHSPRAGDQQAATPAHGSPDAFASGPVCPAAEPPTRDRPRDVLEFPG
ncbi:hypothetical protein ACIQ7Q_01500 [Streptomyces sp. NPDC096176]|uniref:hypothetical protein n=1 Tax=Streptomyces sp. NPDC096176 TaxID=3366079 RepID=UPI00381ADA0D